MKTKEEMAREWVSQFARQLPGSFDHGEGVACYLAGFKSGMLRAAEMVLVGVTRLSKDPNYGGGLENVMRGLLLERADTIRAEAERSE